MLSKWNAMKWGARCKHHYNNREDPLNIIKETNFLWQEGFQIEVGPSFIDEVLHWTI